MIFELDNTEFDIAKSIFSNLSEYQLMLLSVLERNKPGRIFVDDKINPSSGFVYIKDVFLIFAGSSRNTSFSNELKKILAHDIFPNYKGYLNHSVIFYDPEWVEEIKRIFDNQVSSGEGIYYKLNRKKRKEWDCNLSQDFTVEQIDREFIERKSYTTPEEIRIKKWLSNMYGSLEKFYERGFAFSIVHKKKLVVSFCHCSYLSDDKSKCELGIITKSDFQRKGLGKNLLFHMLDHCWQEGVERAGWHTTKDNIASIKLAESVGYKFDREYPMYFSGWQLEAE